MEKDLKRAILKALIDWKSSPIRIPLILRGARQVGKTYIVESFGRKYFDTVITLNLEFQPEYIRCFNTLDPWEIVNKIETITGQPIRPGKTLLFIDEIQMAPEAIVSLRYFKELMPELHVISAGSLLEFVLQEEKFSFPVGRVQFMYMHPLSFTEFLLVNKQAPSYKLLQEVTLTTTIDEVVHDHFMQLIRKYFATGGMPAVVNAYIDKSSFLDCQKLQGAILDTFRRDFGKYATKTQHRNLSLFFEKAPNIVSQYFKFSKITTDIRSKDLRVALDQLCWAGLITQIHATSASGIPLRFHKKENKFKLLFLDIGLLQRANQISFQDIMDSDLMQLNQGMLTEQFVGQELLAYSNESEEKNLYFWQREARGSSAEVDFIINISGKIIPIEVKSGSTGRLKSLKRFMEEKQCKIGVRISELPLSYDKEILTVPFYLIKQLPRLLRETIVDFGIVRGT